MILSETITDYVWISSGNILFLAITNVSHVNEH